MLGAPALLLSSCAAQPQGAPQAAKTVKPLRVADAALAKAPDVRAYVLAGLKELEAGPHKDFKKLLARPDALYHNQVAEMAALESVVYGWDKDPKRATAALDRLRAFAADWKQRTKNGTATYRIDSDFFLGFPLALAAQNLKKAGQWPDDAAFEGDFKSLLKAVCNPLQRGAFNQASSRAVGTDLALRVFPDLNTDGTWKAYVNDVRQDWLKTGDTPENALGYNSIFMADQMQLAFQNDDFASFQRPAVRAMMERFVAQVPPSGHIPAFGDDGIGTPYQGMDAWPAIFECAAALYKDANYQAAAQRVFDAEKPVPPHPLRATQPLMWLALGQNWPSSDLKPVATPPTSRLLTRAGTDDKIVLSAGDSWLLAELTTDGEHTHREQSGALLQFERDGTIFLSGLGYHNRFSENSNTVLFARPDQAFPYRDKMVVPGEWQEATLPTSGMTPDPAKPDDAFARSMDDLTFRLQHDTGKPVDLWLDDVRLSGPNGDKMLLDFEKGVAGFKNATQDTDAKEGHYSVKISAPSGITFNRPSPAPKLSFDSRQYPLLRFWWKISADTKLPGNNRVFIVRTGPANYDFSVALQPFAPQLMKAAVQTNATGDSFSLAQLDGVGVPNTQWTRRTWLLKEGVLVVRDQITAPADKALVAGPLWNLLIPQAPQSGQSAGFDWFDAGQFFGGDERLLVAMDHKTGRTSGVATPPEKLWGDADPQTVWAKSAVNATPTVFTSVLFPHDGATKAEAIAENFKLDGDKLSLQVNGKPVVLNLQDGAPQVVR